MRPSAKDTIRADSKAKPDASSFASAPSAPRAPRAPESVDEAGLVEDVSRMEAHAAQLVAQIEGLQARTKLLPEVLLTYLLTYLLTHLLTYLQARTKLLPEVLRVLYGRMGISPSASSGGSPYS